MASSFPVMNKELSEHLGENKRPENRESKKAKATPWDGRGPKAGCVLNRLWIGYSIGPLSPPCPFIGYTKSK